MANAQAVNKIPQVYPMSHDEFIDLSYRLQKYHAVFYKFWNISKPIFDEREMTAAVYFDKSSGNVIYMKINPNMWEQMSIEQKLFVICHECFHIILKHGQRLFKDKEINHIMANKAADLVVNHTLIEKFDFNRNSIDPENIYCWIDSFFEETDKISSEETFEFYYLKLMENNKNGCQEGIGILVDNHDPLGDSELTQHVIGELNEILTQEEKDTIKSIIEKHGKPKENSEAGKGSGNEFQFFDYDKLKKPKKKWETVIKKWTAFALKHKEKTYEQWVRLPRRMALIRNKSIFVPSDMEIEDKTKEKDKIEVWFFQDTSGSCWDLAERFFKAAASLPEDRFNVRMFCFDDKVYETTLKSGKLYGMGGTSFDIIESHIQKLVREEKCKYPTVFLITDGYGNAVNPQYPKNWHWFLSVDYKAYIPKESHVYKLSDYE